MGNGRGRSARARVLVLVPVGLISADGYCWAVVHLSVSPCLRGLSSTPGGVLTSRPLDSEREDATFRRTLLLLTFAGLVVRAALLVLEPETSPVADERTWTDWARIVAERPSPLAHKMIFHPPLYPYFLAGPYALTGSFAAAQALQVVLAALLIPAVGRVGALTLGRRRPGRGCHRRVLSRAGLVLLPLLGREHLPRPAVVGVERLLTADRHGEGGMRWPPACCGGWPCSPARPPSTSSRGGGVARAPPGAAASRAPRCARRGRSHGRAVDVPQLGRVRRLRPRVDGGRTEPVPGQRAHPARRDLSHGGRGAGPDRAVPLCPRHGAGGDPRSAAGLDLREARRADAAVLGGGEPGAHSREARGVRKGPARGGTRLSAVVLLPYLAVLVLAVGGW